MGSKTTMKVVYFPREKLYRRISMGAYNELIERRAFYAKGDKIALQMKKARGMA